MQRVFVVRGSEDGVLGVATTLKGAHSIAKRLGYEFDYNDLQTLRKEFGSDFYFNMQSIGGGEVEIERFVVEKSRR